MGVGAGQYLSHSFDSSFWRGGNAAQIKTPNEKELACLLTGQDMKDEAMRISRDAAKHHTSIRSR